jgi:mannosylglycerate hydrolase
LVIVSRITLSKGSRQLKVKTSLRNNIRNHRLRVAFPTGIKAEFADASGHFTVDRRPCEPPRDNSGEFWPEMQTLPTQSFVDASDGIHGLAVLHSGMVEYELKPDDCRTLYMTLFRAMGNMIVTWWEAVGVFPGHDVSQLLRDIEFEYAIYPHEGQVYTQARNLNSPLAPYQVSGFKKGALPPRLSLMSCDNPNLILSALNKAEDSDSLILRLFNPTSVEQNSSVKAYSQLKEALLLNLNEEREEALAFDGCVVNVSAKTGKIITIELKF